MIKSIQFLLASALTTAMLAGCGQMPVSEDGPFTPEARAYEALGMAGQGRSPMPKFFLKGLDLSEAQQAQLKAIAEKYHPNAPMQAAHAQLKALLLAEKVDTAALRAFFEAHKAEMEARAPQRLAMLSELRSVLTEAQREKLLSRLEKVNGKARHPFEGMHRKFHEHMLADLQLNAEQKAAVEALNAKFESLKSPESREQGRQAFAAFIRTGDAKAFEATMKASFEGRFPVAELVRVAELLDRAQREKLVKKFDRLQGRHGRGHGNGHGFRGAH